MKTTEKANYMEWADLEAWRGYEFWSAQVEAILEPVAQREGESQSRMIQAAAKKEWKQDVHPF